MIENQYRVGEQLWLRGRRVTLVERLPHASLGMRAAIVRREGEATARVVPLWRLARDRAESLERQYATPAT
jgi:hypothetical protein